MKLREFWVLQNRCTGQQISYMSEESAHEHLAPNDNCIHVREVSPEYDKAVEECERALECYNKPGYKDRNHPNAATAALAALRKAKGG